MAITNPYSAGGTPRKGQTHQHIDPDEGVTSSGGGTGDDGEKTPAELFALLAAAGYDWASVTSHEYLESVQTEATANGVLWVPGEEVSDDTLAGHDHHVVGIGIGDPTTITTGPLTITEDTQGIIDEINALSAFAILAHPNLGRGVAVPTNIIDDTEIDTYTGYHAIELYSSNPEDGSSAEDVYTEGSNSSHNVWDRLLTQGKSIWGVAVTDYHRPLQGAFPQAVDDAFIVAYTDALAQAGLLTSLKAGNFYATQGPLLSANPSVIGNTITVQTADACTIRWRKDNGTIVQTDSGVVSASYSPTGGLTYVRPEITRDSDGLMAWVQPFFVSHSSTIPVIVSGTQKDIALYGDPGSGNRSGPTVVDVTGGVPTYYSVGLVDVDDPAGSGVILSVISGGVETRQELEEV